MLIVRPPMSNAERQREFRKRNPGYYGRLHRKRKAEVAEYGRMQAFALAFSTIKPVLMLPAPVETMGLFDWLTTKPAEREMVEVR